MLRRLGRFAGIWRLGGARVAAAAWRCRCQKPVLEFLSAGGRISSSAVAYGDTVVPRSPFTGRELAGVGYLRRLVDSGWHVSNEDGMFLISQPDGVRFAADGAGLVDAMLMVMERFVDDEYSWIETAGQVVIDVGASIGDSVVYFARKGAAFVYGFEPVTRTLRRRRRT